MSLLCKPWLALRQGRARCIITFTMKARIVAIASITTLLSICLCEGSFAEAVPSPTTFAEIVYVDGSDLTVIRSGGKLESADPIGTRLFPGDQIQTGARTIAELVAMPRKSRIRLSENTVVTIRQLDADGSTELELLYGRIRSKVEKLIAKESPYRVGSRSFVAGVRGTDFGCDIIAARPGVPALDRVYCFEGSVEVRTVQSEPEPGAEATREREKDTAVPVIVSAGSMAVISETAEGKPAAINQAPIETEIRSFWKSNEFTTTMPSSTAAITETMPTATTQTPPAAPVAAPLPVAPPLPQIDLRPIRRGIAAKNGFAIGGSLLAAVGLSLQGVSWYLRPQDAILSDQFLLAGGVTALMGLPFILFSTSIDPMKGIKEEQ
jgi:hypothetical protein